MKFSDIKRNVIFLAGLIGLSLILSRCAASSSTNATISLTTASKMTTGLISATADIQGMGGTLATTSSFGAGGNHIVSTATSCDENGTPGADGHNGGAIDGVVSGTETYSQSDDNYALQKFYCTLAADSKGPETVAGALATIKMVTCAVERNLGSINFNDTPVSFTSITIDTHCATAEKLAGMGATGGSITMTFNGKVTAALNPSGSNWPEVASNNYYNHGIRIVSDDGTALKFILLAKFDDTVSGDPLESGDFEFVTMGSGTLMQGTAIDYTAGKIQRSSATSGTLWYEMRSNRIKTPDINVCQPGNTQADSCGFARHARIKGDLTFTSGDISDVANLTGVIAEGYDTTGSGQSTNFSFAVTATGSLTSEITGKVYTRSASPVAFSGGDTIATFTPGTTTCIISGGAVQNTGCGTPLNLTGQATLSSYFQPSNSTTGTWIDYLSTHGGLGYSGITTVADTQSAL